jgi:adenylate kinase family enzyme
MEKSCKYKRILVLGGGGSGKSTLANRIGEYTGYPVYHLDALLHDSNWRLFNKEKWEEIFKVFLSKDSGVVDGNFSHNIDSRLEWADLIIFINIPTYLQILRMIKRYLKIKFRIEKRYGKPNKANDKLPWSVISWAYHWNSNHKDYKLNISKLSKDKKVLFIKTPRKLNLEELFK